MAVAGRYSPTRVRSSPSSGVMSTRSPTTISCFLGNSILPFAVAGRRFAVIPRRLLRPLGLVNGYQFRNPEPPRRCGEPQTHLFSYLLVAQGASQRGGE